MSKPSDELSAGKNHHRQNHHDANHDAKKQKPTNLPKYAVMLLFKMYESEYFDKDVVGDICQGNTIEDKWLKQ